MKHVALIIEDNPANLAALAALLTCEQVASVTLMSPRDVSATLDQVAQVDVLILDLEFPNLSGLTLIKELQADERLRSVPVVAYSVRTSEQNRARDAGFHSFIGKPLDAEHFPDQLWRILSGHRVWEVE